MATKKDLLISAAVIVAVTAIILIIKLVLKW